MESPRIAVLSFPGMNCEVESVRAIRRNTMEAVPFRWNDDQEKLKECDGYFLPGGFSYEDRGRAGMIAARDHLIDFLREEAGNGKVIIGNCNGAQILVESGLIPLGVGLRMCLARNAVGGRSRGFLNEWVWITPMCKPDRCATSDWGPSTGSGRHVLQLPIAHGEGRFVTKDRDLLLELRRNDQLAFSYCDAEGKASDDPETTPNGSVWAIAGICNAEGNVVALMPHPERTLAGDPYFQSMRKWLLRKKTRRTQRIQRNAERSEARPLQKEQTQGTEIFIDTIITNNEERTVEKALRAILPTVTLKQLRYIALPEGIEPKDVLRRFYIFNHNKEVAYVRKGTDVRKWRSKDQSLEDQLEPSLLHGIAILRRDEPDTGASDVGPEAMTGVCYVLSGIGEEELERKDVQEILANPHASTLTQSTTCHGELSLS